MVSLEHPFESKNIDILNYKITNQNPKRGFIYYSDQLIDLIFSMLNKDYEQRATIVEIRSKMPTNYRKMLISEVNRESKNRTTKLMILSKITMLLMTT